MLKTIAFILAAVCLYTIDATPIHSPHTQCQTGDGTCCIQNGNVYTLIPETNCVNFTQESLQHDPPVLTLQTCGENTVFDVNNCVCNWSDQVTCPPDNTPSPAPAKTGDDLLLSKLKALVKEYSQS